MEPCQLSKTPSQQDSPRLALTLGDVAGVGPEVVARITALSGDAGYAAAVAAILIPDILTFEIGNSAAFLNGRQPSNDVIDAELSVLTNGALTTDLVGSNDVPLPNEFPYLAAAH